MIVSQPILKRVVRPCPVRPTLFINVESGGIIHENGAYLRFDEPIDLAAILTAVIEGAWKNEKPRIIYLVGGWDAASTPTGEWFEAPEGWMRLSYRRSPLIADYKHVETDAKLRVMMSAQWFGRCTSAVVKVLV